MTSEQASETAQRLGIGAAGPRKKVRPPAECALAVCTNDAAPGDPARFCQQHRDVITARVDAAQQVQDGRNRDREFAKEIKREGDRREARRYWDQQEAEQRTAGGVDRMRALLVDTDTLDQLPALVPLIDGWLFRDTLARINGASGSFKSFLLLDWAAHIGAGLAWLGQQVEAGPVVYIVAEGASGIRKRVRAWEKHHGRRMTGVIFLPRPVQTAEAEWHDLVELLAEIKPVLVILDTQARVTVGQNENDATDMGVVVDRLEAMRLATGACVALVHHTGLGDSDRARGSTAVKGAMHTELIVRRNGSKAAPALVLTADPSAGGKQKDTEAAPDARLRVVQVDLGHDDQGRVINSVVLVGEDPFTAPADDTGTESQRQLAEVMRKVFSTGQGGSRAEIKGVVVSDLKLMSKATFYKTFNTLLEAGKIAKLVNDRGLTTERFRWAAPSPVSGAAETD